MPGREVSTIEIVRDALRQGKQVFIPYIHSAQDDQKHKVMDMLRLQDEQDLQSLKPDKWGIPSLSPESIDERENGLGGKGVDDSSDVSDSVNILDLILMPGIAFDTAHNRLGHGKGFYDTYLSKIQRITEASGKSPRFPKLGKCIKRSMIERTDTIEWHWHYRSNSCLMANMSPQTKMTGR